MKFNGFIWAECRWKRCRGAHSEFRILSARCTAAFTLFSPRLLRLHLILGRRPPSLSTPFPKRRNLQHGSPCIFTLLVESLSTHLECCECQSCSPTALARPRALAT